MLHVLLRRGHPASLQQVHPRAGATSAIPRTRSAKTK